MSERDYAPLSIACVRGLCDKLYDKRKFAGAEIEKMVKDFNDANNSNQVRRLIRVLGQDLMASTNPNVKNGALMGLSSVAVGLGKDSTVYLGELTQPILACFNEGESRVRYQAAEALFNVLKIAREASLPHFPAVFDALARLAADPEPQVKQGAELLDRLLKDIVTESESFDLAAFVPLLRARLYTRQPGARQFAAGWLAALDAVPGLELLPHLPQLLDGLFNMLDDPMPEIRRMCDIQLGEFLRSIKKEPERADLPAMINVLITHAQAPEELVQLTAITWVKEFVSLAGGAMLPSVSGILLAVLPCLAYADEPRRNIRESAAIVNLLLTKLVGVEGAPAGAEGAPEGAAGEGPGGRLEVGAVVGALLRLLRHSSVHTKVAALDWILHLYSKLPDEMVEQTETVFTSCVRVVSEPSDDVVRRGLCVLAEICSAGGSLEANPYYHKFLRTLLQMLAEDDALLEDRGAFIIRQLCVLLSAEDVYRALATLLRQHAELRFCAAAAHVLSCILLTAPELHDLRAQLRAFHKSTQPLFEALYRCWCHAPVALLALCLLTHNYRHCSRLVATFGDLEITVDFLTEVDKLVQLIESPIFAYMRLELLGGAGGAELRAALYGLLMLLPQSEAFHTLRRRLQCAPAEAMAGAEVAGAGGECHIDFDALLDEFHRVQRAHRLYRVADRRALHK